ncbi:hypothetical protein [uncultured Lacinutrix sp.]|uniref:hypothetical protein n=1 Tax=uncultured Lacinutrix sp. TaxID=574032 RepID=UPI00262F1FD0|nr:hypothetical protein [uncultured Lacinutrix sp.]
MQNDKEKLLIGNWIEEQRSDDKKEWNFTEKGTVNLYFNNNINGSFYYSVSNECPKKCEKYKSKWKIDNYLYLKSTKDTLNTKCYEIIFEENKDVSLRYLPLERDTFEILKRK